MQNEIQFQKEQDDIFSLWWNNILTYWRKTPAEKELIKKSDEAFFLELYITATCNQKCTYCYLTSHGEELYPIELRDKNKILQNLISLFDYLSTEKIYIERIDFFSGEIWGTQFGDDILNLTLKYLCKENFNVGCIIIPSNFSFCSDKKIIDKINKYIQAFRKVHCNLQFSCSIDGPFLDNLNRPLNNNQQKTSDFYNNVFTFCKENKFGYHPMIAASTIEYQIDNYKNWISTLKNIYKDDLGQRLGILMQLEVRNGDWTFNKILHYLKWLNFVIDTDRKTYFQTQTEFNDYFVYGKLPDYLNHQFTGYVPYRLIGSTGPNAGSSHCTIGSMICVRMGDLSIVPCHRTSYEKFILGHFIQDKDNKIINLKAQNLSLLNSIYRTHYGLKPKCDTCLFEKFCLRGCLGSQYENNKDLFYPVENVCFMQQAKIIFLFEKGKKIGAIKEEAVEQFALIDYYHNIKKTKEYEIWLPHIQKIL